MLLTIFHEASFEEFLETVRDLSVHLDELVSIVLTVSDALLESFEHILYLVFFMSWPLNCPWSIRDT